MKKTAFLSLIIICLLGVNTVFAQGQGQKRGQGQKMSSEERIKMTMDTLNASLNMSESQQGEMEKTFTAFYKKMDDLRSNSTERPDRSKMEALIDDRDNQVKEILDKKQYKEYLQVMENMRNQMRGRMGGANGQRK